jgi:hypothetical protein
MISELVGTEFFVGIGIHMQERELMSVYSYPGFDPGDLQIRRFGGRGGSLEVSYCLV